jgi:hypothetical protein
MRLFSTISDGTSSTATSAKEPTTEEQQAEWTTQMATVAAAQPELDVWFVENSIVSILLHHSGNGSLFDIDELDDVCRYMSMDVSRNVPRSANANERAILATICSSNNIGPPSLDVAVADGATRAILSISLGTNCLEDGILENDTIAIKKLALVAKYYVALTMSNVL